MERNSTGTTLLWFVGGTLLGGALALLLAPESGEETRKKLAVQAQRGCKAFSESSQDIVDRGRELYERGREVAEQAADLFERGRQVAEKRVNETV